MISLKLHNFKSLKDSNLIFSADIENRILRVLSKGLSKKNNAQFTKHSKFFKKEMIIKNNRN